MEVEVAVVSTQVGTQVGRPHRGAVVAPYQATTTVGLCRHRVVLDAREALPCHRAVVVVVDMQGRARCVRAGGMAALQRNTLAVPLCSVKMATVMAVGHTQMGRLRPRAVVAPCQVVTQTERLRCRVGMDAQVASSRRRAGVVNAQEVVLSLVAGVMAAPQWNARGTLLRHVEVGVAGAITQVGMSWHRVVLDSLVVLDAEAVLLRRRVTAAVGDTQGVVAGGVAAPRRSI